MKAINITLITSVTLLSALGVAYLGFGVAEASGPMLALICFNAGILFAKGRMEKENPAIAQS